jgi:hypothetical protein
MRRTMPASGRENAERLLRQRLLDKAADGFGSIWVDIEVSTASNNAIGIRMNAVEPSPSEICFSLIQRVKRAS